MPEPRSDTVEEGRAVVGAGPGRRSAWPPGVWPMALASRLSTTWRSRRVSPETMHRRAGGQGDVAVRGRHPGRVDGVGGDTASDRPAPRPGGAPGRGGRAGAGRRRARSCGWPRSGCGASRWPGPRGGHARRGRRSPRSPGSTSAACAARARRRPGSGRRRSSDAARGGEGLLDLAQHRVERHGRACRPRCASRRRTPRAATGRPRRWPRPWSPSRRAGAGRAGRSTTSGRPVRRGRADDTRSSIMSSRPRVWWTSVSGMARHQRCPASLAVPSRPPHRFGGHAVAGRCCSPWSWRLNRVPPAVPESRERARQPVAAGVRSCPRARGLPLASHTSAHSRAPEVKMGRVNDGVELGDGSTWGALVDGVAACSCWSTGRTGTSAARCR